MLNFYSIKPKSDDLCLICRDDSTQKPYVAHEDGGEKHPFHKDCIKLWFNSDRKHAVCVYCSKPVNVASLNSWSEQNPRISRCLDRIVHIGTGLAAGALVSMTLLTPNGFEAEDLIAISAAASFYGVLIPAMAEKMLPIEPDQIARASTAIMTVAFSVIRVMHGRSL